VTGGGTPAFAGGYNRGVASLPPVAPVDVSEIASALCRAGRRFDERGWVLGTSGNFSALLDRDPLRLVITPSAAFKGELAPEQLLEMNDHGAVVRGGAPGARPSAEALLHVEIVRSRGAGAVLHTHSIWSTLVSDVYGDDGGVEIAGYEMLKGLDGVTTHEHREWLPILENDQDIPRLSTVVRGVLSSHPAAHGFLLRRHGLYTWGAGLRDAVRHVEILEFLMETIARRAAAASLRGSGAPPHDQRTERSDTWPS
jgi:methylthioribulose-1-phosphate dehydratase